MASQGTEPTPKTKTQKTMEERIADLRARREQAQLGGGKSRIEKQHNSGKLSARERIERLADPDSFQEIALFAEHRATLFGMAKKDLPADGVVTGCATVDRRLIHLASQDFTVAGGAAGEVHCDKIAAMMEMSLKTGSPFVFINDSGGARVQEGIDSLAGYGRVFYQQRLLSGTVPQISVICGPCAGGAAYSPALTDFIIQTRERADVHYRAAGDQAGDRRGGHRRGTGRPAGANEYFGRGPLGGRKRRRSALSLPPAAELFAFQQSRRSAAPALRLPLEDDPELERSCPRKAKLATTCARSLPASWITRTFWKSSPGSRRTS